MSTITTARSPKPEPEPLVWFYLSFIPDSRDNKDAYEFRPHDLCFFRDGTVEINGEGEEEYSSAVETEEDVRDLLNEAFDNGHTISRCVRAWKATFGEEQAISRCVKAWKEVSGKEQVLDQSVKAWKEVFGNQQVLDFCERAWQEAFDNQRVLDRCAKAWKELCTAAQTSEQSPANDDAPPGETAVRPGITTMSTTTIACSQKPKPLLRFYFAFIPDSFVCKDEYAFRPHDLCFFLDGIVVINGKGEEEYSSAVETEEDVRARLKELVDDEPVADLCVSTWKLRTAAHIAEQPPANDGPYTPPESSVGSDEEDQDEDTEL